MYVHFIKYWMAWLMSHHPLAWLSASYTLEDIPINFYIFYLQWMLTNTCSCFPRVVPFGINFQINYAISVTNFDLFNHYTVVFIFKDFCGQSYPWNFFYSKNFIHKWQQQFIYVSAYNTGILSTLTRDLATTAPS